MAAGVGGSGGSGSGAGTECGPWLAVAPGLSDVQTVRAALLTAGWLDRSKHRRQQKMVRDDGSVAVALPVVHGVSPVQLASQGFAHVIEVEGPTEKPTGPLGGDNSPAARLHHAVAPVLTAAEVNPVDARLLLADLPRRWERHGDLILLSKTAFASDQWREHVTPLLWTAVANALRATKIARKADVDPGLRRESRVVLLHGDDGWVRHVDNGVIYTYDATRCMFSTGNITEKVRVAQLGQEGEVVVDLYAGIGYFTLPYLVKALVQHVYACEWNPHAADALRRNLEVNGVSERCTVFEGDNAELAPRDVADRVNLGLIPTSERGWAVGCAALKQRSGGWLHVHDNVEVPKEEAQAAAFARRGTAVTAALEGLVQKAHGGEWSVTLHHAERVKSYAPRVFHVVFDIEVRPLDAS